MFCTIFGILNILISILSIKIISNDNILIENDNTENKLLFALAIATTSSALLTFALDGLEINEYRKFKKGNKELLMKIMKKKKVIILKIILK